MKLKLFFFSLICLVVSCSDNTPSSEAPCFGYHVDRIVRVNEGNTAIGVFQAADEEGDAISYSISNTEMTILQDGTTFFNDITDFETKDAYSATITASNDAGSDEISLTVYINDSDCELDTAAAFDACYFK